MDLFVEAVNRNASSTVELEQKIQVVYLIILFGGFSFRLCHR